MFLFAQLFQMMIIGGSVIPSNC